MIKSRLIFLYLNYIANPMGLKIEIPAEIAKSIRLPESEVEERLRKELAVRLYEKGLLGFGKARELAGMTKWEFHELLAKEKVVRRYDLEELEKDEKVVRELIE